MVHAQSRQVGSAMGACNTKAKLSGGRGGKGWSGLIVEFGHCHHSLPSTCIQGHGGPRYPTLQRGKTPKVLNLGSLRIRIRMYIAVSAGSVTYRSLGEQHGLSTVFNYHSIIIGSHFFADL